MAEHPLPLAAETDADEWLVALASSPLSEVVDPRRSSVASVAAAAAALQGKREVSPRYGSWWGFAVVLLWSFPCFMSFYPSIRTCSSSCRRVGPGLVTSPGVHHVEGVFCGALLCGVVWCGPDASVGSW